MLTRDYFRVEDAEGRGEFLPERRWEAIPGPRTFGLQQSDELARPQQPLRVGEHRAGQMARQLQPQMLAGLAEGTL